MTQYQRSIFNTFFYSKHADSLQPPVANYVQHTAHDDSLFLFVRELCVVVFS